MKFQARLPNCARLRQIEINGMLLAVLKCRAQQKRHRPPHDKTSGLSFDTALSDEQANEQKERKKSFSETSQLENPEELQLHHNHEKFLFSTVLLLFAQYKMYNW
jgi:hypothetical protein